VPEIGVGDELAKLMKVKVGGSLTLLATTTEGNLNAVDVIVRGIVKTGVPDIDRRLVMTDIRAVQRLLLTDKVGTLAIYLKDTAQTGAMAAQVKASIRSWRCAPGATWRCSTRRCARSTTASSASSA
jgi:putative ABC transport system permease protein